MKVLLRNLVYLFILSSWLFSSCNSKRYGFVKRTYHDITAHYNGYFNAKYKIDQVESQNEKSYQDKYDDLISVFKLSKEEEAGGKASKGGNQSLDEAIKKASIVIQRHERSKWIDDCYLEIGRAYFYKKDYFTAAETFQFIAGKYRGKEVGNEAYIWLIKSYMMLRKYQQAESVINVALASETFPKKHVPNLFACIAWYHIEKKNYPKAIEYLEKAAPIEKKKSNRARYIYLTAQLYEKIEEEGKASYKYQQVVKMNPPYDLLFNARINSARLVQASTAGTRKNLEKELTKMLEDVKNKEYRDQLYYSLGLIYERSNDEKKAINAYRMSAATSVSNLTQKGKSYLKLATIFYDDEKYESAQIYYDSASTFLSKNHPDFELTNKRKISLGKLVENLKTINREDSLQRLSRMPEKDLLAHVEDVIKKEKAEKIRKEEEEKRQAELALSNMSRSNDLNSRTPTGTTQGNTWYFYNQNALGSGANDFIKKFGRRSLEDNWRRANKESFASINSIANGEQELTEEVTGNAKNSDEALKKKYLANVPLSPAAFELSVDRMIKAYFNIGQFYREEIINTKESINAYLTCITRFPNNKLSAEIYFNLYRLNTQINNKPQADLYKGKLLNEYPNTLFAKVILDPSYISESKANDKAAQVFYDNLYESYLNNNYTVVTSAKGRIDSHYNTTSIAPRYYYLYALSENKLKGVDAFELCLNDLIKKYPSSEAASMARENLQKLMEIKNPSLKKVHEPEAAPYELEQRAKYYALITLDLSSTRETKASLLRFNNMEFSLKKLQIFSDLIGDNEQTLYITSFEDANAAREYITALNKKVNEVIKLKPGTYAVSFISEKNYKILKETKAIQQYIKFYNANYLINE